MSTSQKLIHWYRGTQNIYIATQSGWTANLCQQIRADGSKLKKGTSISQ